MVLNSRSSNLLLSQGFYYKASSSKYEVIAPKAKMPMQFNHHSEGGPISFWVGQKFPRIAVCFGFGLGNKKVSYFSCEAQLTINGHKATNIVQHFLSMVGDHIWLYHLEDLMDLTKYLLHVRNHVEVSCEIIDVSESAEVTIYFCGVHEYEENEEMNDSNLLLYTSSSPNNSSVAYKVNDPLDNTQFSKESHDNQRHCGDGLKIDCHSTPINLRLCEISDEHLQQLSASINPVMLEGNGCMDQEIGNTNSVMSDDALHHSKEVVTSSVPPLDNVTWDSMLLEFHLNHKHENQLTPYNNFTTDNKEVEYTRVTPVCPVGAGTKAFNTFVPNEVSESQNKRRLNKDTVVVESKNSPEVPGTSCTLINPPFTVQLTEKPCSIGKCEENSWEQAQRCRTATVKSERTQNGSLPIKPAEGPSVLESKTKGNELAMIPMEPNTNQSDSTLIDDNMEAFYATLHAETSSYLSPSNDTTDDTKLANFNMSEETKKALKILQEFLSTQFSHLLQTGQSNSMKSIIDLCTLSADDEVSMGLKSLLLQLLKDFTQWSWDYNEASMKLESTTARLAKLDTLDEGLTANMNQFTEFATMENELCSQLAYLEERKKELEEQINAIKTNIFICAVARDTALGKKRETFEEGRTLKTERDEFRKQRPRLRAEQAAAKATQAYIEDEWSKIREQFNIILNKLG